MLHPQTIPLLLIALVVLLIGSLGFRLPVADAGAALLALLDG